MKRFILSVIAVLITSVTVNAAVLDFKSADAQNDKMPMAVLVYAQWAEKYQIILSQFRVVEQRLGNSYNFVELNIADKGTKNYNDKYVINTKLPYIMVFRDKGKFALQLDKSCALSSACIEGKLKDFLR